MDERTSVLLCLGAATAANCIPCFEHYFKKAAEVGLTKEEVQEAADLGNKVKGGAQMVMRNSIRNIMGDEKTQDRACGGQLKSPCCG